MLKIFRGLFLGLVVLVGSACVTPTHVSSAFADFSSSVAITYIQASGVSGARDEAVVLFNNTNQEVDITNWCLTNKSQAEFACFLPSAPAARLLLPAKAHVAVISNSYAEQLGDIAETMVVFEPLHASSGSITGSADTITLVDAGKSEVSQYSWATTLPSGKAHFRVKSDTTPPEYSLLGTDDDWYTGSALEALPVSVVLERELVVENQGSGGEVMVEYPIITELLPNATGVDAGNEFIELYNPSRVHEIELSLYKLKIGDKLYSFPAESILVPGEFKAFYNDNIRFTLPNSSGQVQLILNDKSVGPLIEYNTPPEGESWSLIGGAWLYTTLVTPGTENKNNQSLPVVSAVTKNTVAGTSKPCAANQYRHPETNRCRKITAEAAPVPCKAGQERNKETGRCRNVAVAGALTSCKAGQERNPETNRCRKIEKMTNAPHGLGPVKQDSSHAPAWYMWAAIAGIVLAVIGYGVWEWRQELSRVWLRIRKGVGRKGK